MIEMRIGSGVPDATKKRCYDCKHMKAAVSWWCTSEEASDYHGTHIPGFDNCKFWEPIKKPTWFEKWFSFNVMLVHIDPDEDE